MSADSYSRHVDDVWDALRYTVFEPSVITDRGHPPMPLWKVFLRESIRIPSWLTFILADRMQLTRLRDSIGKYYDFMMGKIYGYPDCCIRNFIEGKEGVLNTDIGFRVELGMFGACSYHASIASDPVKTNQIF